MQYVIRRSLGVIMRCYVLSIIFIVSTAFSQAATTWPVQLHNPFVDNESSNTALSMFIPLQYIDPKEFATLIKDQKSLLLSAQALVIVQEKEHAIWVKGNVTDIKTIKNLVANIDRPRQQLLLKARIVSIDNNFVQDLGVLFESSSALNVASSRATNHPVSSGNTIGSFAIPIANLQDGYLLDVKLNALEKKGHAKVVSSPELVTLDHDPAVIESGEEIPYQQETLSGGTAVSFKKAVLKLQVTPHILPDRHVLLDINVNQDKVSLLTVQGVPAIHTQQVSTQIEVKNRQTFVLGGVDEDSFSNEIQGVPYLKDIPLLGYLFRSYHDVNEQRELLVFVTVEMI